MQSTFTRVILVTLAVALVVVPLLGATAGAADSSVMKTDAAGQSYTWSPGHC